MAAAEEVAPRPAAAQPRSFIVDAGGLPLCVFEWGNAPSDRTPSIVLAHATGFHARCWDRVSRLLPGLHVLAVDLRGHGRSGGDTLGDWRELGADLATLATALSTALGVSRALWVGHSMGGHAVTVAAAQAPAAVGRLLLLDPVIFAPEAYERRWNPMAPPPGQRHPVARRRNRFASAEEMFDTLRPRAPFADFDEAALRDYCRHGLRPAVDGDGLDLCCAPDFEARVYETGASNAAIHADVRAVAVPVTVARARQPSEPTHLQDFSYSPTWPGLAQAFADGRDVPLPELGHFIPMQAPERTAALIRAEAQALATHTHAGDAR